MISTEFVRDKFSQGHPELLVEDVGRRGMYREEGAHRSLEISVEDCKQPHIFGPDAVIGMEIQLMTLIVDEQRVTDGVRKEQALNRIRRKSSMGMDDIWS